MIAWGDNQTGPPGQGPDNFRLLFIANLTSATTGPNSDQGRETMRITPRGNIGMGNSFSNALQPSRRLVVHERTDSPQFRIAWGLDSDPVLGQHADFQVTDNGVLHIKNRDENNRRPVVVGFLENEDANPTAFTYLDVGGITRIRDLREDSTKTCLVLGTFADTTAQGDSADHYLTRLDFPQDSTLFLAGDATWRPGAGSDNDWESDGTDVWTGHGLNGFPGGSVYVGEDPTTAVIPFDAKLLSLTDSNEISLVAINTTPDLAIRGAAVFEVSGTGSINVGTQTRLFSSLFSNNNIGNDIQIRHPGRRNIGVRAIAQGAFSEDSENIGVQGIATQSAPPADIHYGVFGIAGRGIKDNYGIYGEYEPSLGMSGWAGYFVGDVFTTGNYLPSDENYKTNINELEEASTLLGQLNPVSYEYNNEMGIPFGEGLLYGLVSQEVEEVLPSLVRDVTVPVKLDSLGEVIREEMVIKSLRHNDFLALLIKGHQEQNALITDQAAMLTEQEAENEELLSELNELKTQMADMQNQMTEVMASFQSTQSKMNNCCGTTPSEKSRSETGAIELEQNFPNPFEDVTTINFSINEPAQIRLEISDAQGRVLDVVVNQRMDKGEYTERWDGSAVAPGTCYYSLYADTELLTKKMIKR
ncbi:MAG: hypothetical protein ACJAQ4_001262 [Cryomorphaceae bacterium]